MPSTCVSEYFTDASTDLAVLSVKVKDIPSDTMDKIKVATLGKSEDIKVGESVVAIGIHPVRPRPGTKNLIRPPALL